MPGTTTNFAIPYPCDGDAVSLNDYVSFSNAVDSATATVDALKTLALKRTGAIITSAGPGSFGQGVQTNINGDTVRRNVECTCTLTPAQIVVNRTGVYMLTAQIYPDSFGLTTISYIRLMLNVNGTMRAANKHSTRDGGSGVVVPVNVSVMYPMTAGDSVRASVLWVGTGGPMTMKGFSLTARLAALP